MASRKGPAAKKSLEEPKNSVGYLLRFAHRSYLHALGQRTLPFGVSSGQWHFLRILWTEDGLTQIELSRRAGMREPTTVTAVNGLEKAGLVRRRKSSSDRRKIHICLTSRGKSLKSKLLPFVAEVNALGLKGFSAQEIRSLRRALLKIINNHKVGAGGRGSSAFGPDDAGD
jgi:DNA-binding MarR family transcriptional regulator